MHWIIQPVPAVDDKYSQVTEVVWISHICHPELAVGLNAVDVGAPDAFKGVLASVVEVQVPLTPVKISG